MFHLVSSLKTKKYQCYFANAKCSSTASILFFRELTFKSRSIAFFFIGFVAYVLQLVDMNCSSQICCKKLFYLLLDRFEFQDKKQ